MYAQLTWRDSRASCAGMNVSGKYSLDMLCARRKNRQQRTQNSANNTDNNNQQRRLQQQQQQHHGQFGKTIYFYNARGGRRGRKQLCKCLAAEQLSRPAVVSCYAKRLRTGGGCFLLCVFISTMRLTTRKKQRAHMHFARYSKGPRPCIVFPEDVYACLPNQPAV